MTSSPPSLEGAITDPGILGLFDGVIGRALDVIVPVLVAFRACEAWFVGVLCDSKSHYFSGRAHTNVYAATAIWLADFQRDPGELHFDRLAFCVFSVLGVVFDPGAAAASIYLVDINPSLLDAARSSGERSSGKGPRPRPDSVRSSESFEPMSGSGHEAHHVEEERG